MRSPAVVAGDVPRALKEATEAAAQVLAVRRVSVWRFDDDKTSIECLDLFDSVTKEHTAGTRLYARDAPKYFAAVSEERTIAAHEARTDPRTREFTESYLAPLGIVSMLDAPILVHGQLVGVICCEHIGEMRRWEPNEELVAGTLADFVGMALGTADHIALQASLEDLVEQRTRQLQASQATVRKLFEVSPVALVVSHASDQTVLLANERASAMFGVPMSQAPGKSAPDFWVNADDRQKLIEGLKDSGISEGFEAELKTATGKRFWGIISASRLDFEDVPAIVVGVHDITPQHEAHQALATLLEAAPVPLLVTSVADGVVRFGNTRAADMFKLPREELVGKAAPEFYMNPEDRTRLLAAVRSAGHVDGYAMRLRAADGTIFWSLVSGRLLELSGVQVFKVGIADLTEQKEIEQRLRDFAELDGLTGAFNRRHFFDVAGAALRRTVERGRPVCVAMLDVDHFKDVNDKHGHAVGDEALRHLTNICRSASRGSDILARYGGEELVLLLPEADAEAAKRVGERIRAGLAEPGIKTAQGEELEITVSIGIAQNIGDESIDELLRRADEAMYEAKRAGRDRIVIAR